MATDQERLVLQMSADLRSFEREMARARQVTERRMREVEQAALRADKNLSRIMSQAGSNATDALKRGLVSVAPTIAAAFSARQVQQYADAWTSGRNALAAAGVATEDLARRQNELVDLANETRTSTESTIALYRRLSIANEELGLSSGQVLRITELLNKSFSASGASTQEAAAAALQLSQALASGVLQGDELRSIRENAPQIAQAIARAMGVGIGELKKLGAEGKITADIVAKAILDAGDKIEAKFATTTATVGQAFQILDNQLGRFIGQADAGVSASQRVAQAIISLADNLDKLVPVIEALAVLIGTRMVLALTANSGAMIANGVAALRLAAFQTAMTASMTGTTRATLLATTAMRGFGAALLANPIGAAIIAVAALSAGLIYLADKSDKAKQAQAELNGVLAKTDEALASYEQALADAATKSGEARKQALEHAAALRTLAADAVFAAQMLAEQRVQQTKLAAEEARAARDKAARTDRQSRTGSGGGTPGVNPLQSANNLAVGIAERDLKIAEEAQRKAEEERDKAQAKLDSLTKGGVEAFEPKGATGETEAQRKARLKAEREAAAAARKAEAERLREVRGDKAFDADLRRAQIDYLEVQVEASDVAKERLRLEKEKLSFARDQRLKEIAAEGPQGTKRYTAEEVAQLQDLERRTTAQRLANLDDADLERGRADNARIAQAELDASIEAAQIAAQLATTAAQRREAELRLLDLTEERERAEAEAIIASRDATDADKEIARRRLRSIGATRGDREEGIRRDTAGPIEDYLSRIPRTADEVNEAMQRLAVDGLENLSNGLADAIANARDLGDVAKNVFRQMIADMLAESFRKNLISPVLSAGASLFGIPIGRNAGGTNNWRGGLSLVGERGPELVNLPKGAQVIPNDVLRSLSNLKVSAPSGGHATLKMEVNVVGAIGPDGIAAIAKREAQRGGAMALEAAKRGYPAVQERQRRLGTS